MRVTVRVDEAVDKKSGHRMLDPLSHPILGTAHPLRKRKLELLFSALFSMWS